MRAINLYWLKQKININSGKKKWTLWKTCIFVLNYGQILVTVMNKHNVFVIYFN